jgi:hypothetical protein
MRWTKKGLIFGPDRKSEWADNSALTPTPLLIDENRIRVFAGFRDSGGISRIGYVDLDGENPSRVIGFSQDPVLDIGIPGTFDDNGVILGDILRVGSRLFMYYVGFQKPEKVKFLAFSGLAISEDGGDSFCRFQKSPVIDRSDKGLFIGAIHSILKEDDMKFRAWIALGNGWETIKGKLFPRYDIHHVESDDGIHFHQPTFCIGCRNDEYRIGRPRVWKENGTYCMHYTKGTRAGEYLAGYAESSNGLNWDRKDELLGIGLSSAGWDSRHLCYPALLKCKGRTYMFYNGNDMGKDGFGYAVLEEN